MVAPPPDLESRSPAELSRQGADTTSPNEPVVSGCGKCDCHVVPNAAEPSECEATAEVAPQREDEAHRCEGCSDVCGCNEAGGCDCHGGEEAAGCEGNCACDGCHGSCECGDAGCEDDCACDGCHGSCDCDASIDAAWLDEHAPAVDTPTPDIIIEHVAACIRFVQDALGFELDVTPETLPILDHYLLAARETLGDRPELRELVWRCAGAYFGELVRRRYNGFWSLPNSDVHTWRINQSQVLLSFNPVGVVAEAVAGSDQGEGPDGALRLAHADQEEVANRLAQIPPLPEDQYYLLTTRLEVIDTVIEHLRVRMEQNDQAEVVFDPDDYLTDLKPYGRA